MRRALAAFALLVLLAPLVHASELRRQDGVSILILDGAPSERGHAHGRLLAKEILAASGELERLRRRSSVTEEKPYLDLLAKFRWSDDESAELDGIVAGVHEALGADVKVPGTERAFGRREVLGINTLADLLPLACSSFTVSGTRVEGGGTITGRNLDYPVFENALAQRLVIVRAARGGAQGWATIGWPGTIGCFTGMNDRGVTASIHDVPTSPAFLLGEGFTPRTLGLRRILEHTSPEGYAETAAKILRGCPVAYGNNIHVSAPGNATPAVILEWDPDRTREEGVTIREAKDHAVVCTNHWRSRRPAEACPRYAALEKAIEERRAPWTAKDALDALGLAAVSGEQDLTLHSAVFTLESRKLLVAFARDAAHPAPRERAVELDLGRLIDDAAKKWY